MTEWKHPLPATVDDIQLTRQATLQPEWAITERLEALVQVLERIATALETTNPPA